MKISVDHKLRIKATLMFALEFYKVVMGTLLTMVVPHTCDPVSKDVCTVTQVLHELRGLQHCWWRRVAFALNIVSMLTVFVMYALELYREHWIIEHLDIDPEKSNTNLDCEIEDYPDMKRDMHRLNVMYWRASTSVCVAVALNFVLSFTYLFQYYAGTTTLTAAVSYFILVSLKLYTTQQTASVSLQQERAYSAYMTVQKTFNTIDSDYVNTSPHPSAL